MQSTDQQMIDLFKDQFESYIDEAIYEFIFEEMLPAIVPLVEGAKGFSGKELSAELQQHVHDESMELAKSIMNGLVSEYNREYYGG